MYGYGPLQMENTLQLTLCRGDKSKYRMFYAPSCCVEDDGSAPALVTSDVLERLQHIFGVVGVEVSLVSAYVLSLPP